MYLFFIFLGCVFVAQTGIIYAINFALISLYHKGWDDRCFVQTVVLTLIISIILYPVTLTILTELLI